MNPPQLFPLPKLQQFQAALAPTFPDLCLIQTPLTGASDQDAFGALHGRAVRQFQTLAGHDSIQCTVSPEGGTGPTASKEQRTQEYIAEWNLFEIILLGYFPAIKQTHQAIVSGVTYEIQGVTFDVYKLLTHLHCRILTV